MSDKRKRNEQVHVRLTLDELMTITDNALDAGFTSIPDFFRSLGLREVNNDH